MLGRSALHEKKITCYSTKFKKLFLHALIIPSQNGSVIILRPMFIYPVNGCRKRRYSFWLLQKMAAPRNMHVICIRMITGTRFYLWSWIHRYPMMLSYPFWQSMYRKVIRGKAFWSLRIVKISSCWRRNYRLCQIVMYASSQTLTCRYC